MPLTPSPFALRLVPPDTKPSAEFTASHFACDLRPAPCPACHATACPYDVRRPTPGGAA